MFKIDPITKQISLTRGDSATINLSASIDGNTNYEFKTGEVVRFKVFKKKECENLILVKDTIVEEDTTNVDISLTKEDTKIGEIINKAVDYWYEVELNPDTNPQTIIGYEVDEKNKELCKIFKLLPEGSDE